MICSIHENYGLAPETFEIADPQPPITPEEFAAYLKESLKKYVEVTGVELASLRISSDDEVSKTINRMMVNIDTSLVTKDIDYQEVIRDTADIIFMTSAGLE